jgi:excisionase family DNA binding protein
LLEAALKHPQPFRSYERLDRLLSIDAIARWLNTPASQIEQMAEAESIPARQLGGRWLFSAQAISSWSRGSSPHPATGNPVIAEQMANLDANLTSLFAQLVRIQRDLQAMRPRHRQPDSVGTLTSTGKEVAFALDPLLTLDELEAAYLRYVLRRCDGNKTVAAGRLRIDPSTLYRKLERLEERERAAGSGS